MGKTDRKSASTRESRAWVLVWLALAVVTMLAIYRVRDFPARLSWSAALGGIETVISATGPAAVRVWLFWAWGAAVLGGFALTVDPGLDLMDAALAAQRRAAPGYVEMFRGGEIRIYRLGAERRAARSRADTRVPSDRR